MLSNKAQALTLTIPTNTKHSRDEDEEREMLRKERKRLKRAEEFEKIISDSLVLDHHAVQEQSDIQVQGQPDSSQPEECLQLQTIHTTCSGRPVRLPRQYVDFLPPTVTQRRQDTQTNYMHPSPHTSEHQIPHSQSPQGLKSSEDMDEIPSENIEMKPDSLSLYRIYLGQPSSTPESGMSLDAICDAPNLKADMTE
ncbi:hypothetical protein SERLA73DRAFT_80017 [Serpula lacrymans var. lacrymans S7.3]|uniref:Uncharacterized protein n=2 Tax=Serpula lacrymans var. lacrymans TaxID=341189 RepID=F8QID6_SERL3|nr:uncharacterized protein SERLADRAFT_434084 [Serpula lacrymans var. lacrymans S7.9]EGN91935.1 hypothetical protein SERLA73DRAFT_80017 [Serpula lacrymans var. lacrymans S7.3]EGO28211.1 hypothetical protein SERLADRAFT_434084 [Serpula lacrymans var. lacrymans S7.9]